MKKLIQMTTKSGESLYPMIHAENIPTDAVTEGKLADGSITEDKLDEGTKGGIDKTQLASLALLQALGKDSEHFTDSFVRAGLMPIPFKDPEVKRILVEHYDKDGDGEISYEEAHAVKDDWRGWPVDLFCDGTSSNTTITSFKEMRFFDSITSVGNTMDNAKAFYDCTNLKEIELPQGITLIGNNTFKSTALEKVDVPASVKTIQKCFIDCSELKEVTLHEGLETIGNDTFNSCNKLQRCDLPSTVKTIGARAFYNCYDLEMSELPEGLTSLGEGG